VHTTSCTCLNVLISHSWRSYAVLWVIFQCFITALQPVMPLKNTLLLGIICWIYTEANSISHFKNFHTLCSPLGPIILASLMETDQSALYRGQTCLNMHGQAPIYHNPTIFACIPECFEVTTLKWLFQVLIHIFHPLHEGHILLDHHNLTKIPNYLNCKNSWKMQCTNLLILHITGKKEFSDTI
jgi:hypothetical protein